MSFVSLTVEAMLSVLSSLLKMLVIALPLSLFLIIVVVVEAILVDLSSSIDMLWLLGRVVVVVVVVVVLSLTTASTLTAALFEAFSLTPSFSTLESETAE